MNRIKEIRLKVGMTQIALAKALGVSQPYIYDLENGNRRLSKANKAKIADLLECKPEDIEPQT